MSRAVRETGRRAEGWALLQPYATDGALAGISARTALRLCRELANYLGDNRDRDPGERAWAEQALAYAEQTGDPAEISLALNCIYIAEVTLGHPRMGAAALEVMIELGRAHRLGTPLALALRNKANFYYPRDLEVALACGYEALDLARSHGDTAVASSARCVVGVALTITGHWDEAAELWALPPTADGLTPLDATVIELVLSAHLARAREQDVEIEALGRALDLVDDALADTQIGVWARLLQHLHARLTGDLPRAARCATESAELAIRLEGMDDDTPLALPWAVDALIETGDLDDARGLLSHVDAADSYLVPPLLAGQALRLHGTIEAADPASAADPADTERSLRAGIEALDHLGAVPDRARAQAALGSYLARHGRPAEAAEHRHAARATFTDLGATRWLRELDESSQPHAMTS